MELNSSQKPMKPDRMREFLESTRALTDDLARLPLHDWQQELQSLRNDLSKEIHDAVKAAMEPPTRIGTATWAQAAAHAPAPAHQLSLPSSSNASPPASPDMARDRDVIICLNDRDQEKRYRGQTSQEIKAYANKVRADFAKESGTATLATVMVRAVRQLKSGDLRITVRDAREAQLMRLHRGWVKSFGSTAFIHMPSWGVIVHGVQVKSLIDRPMRGNPIQALREAQEAMGKAIVAENSRYWETIPPQLRLQKSTGCGRQRTGRS
jgi:hypothetical protein